MAGVRAIIAERMAHLGPHHRGGDPAERGRRHRVGGPAHRLKEALAKELGFDVGYNDLLAVIVARCLVEFPYMNVRLDAAMASASCRT